MRNELPTIATVFGLQIYTISKGTSMHTWRIRCRQCKIVNWTMNEWTFCIKWGYGGLTFLKLHRVISLDFGRLSCTSYLKVFIIKLYINYIIAYIFMFTVTLDIFRAIYHSGVSQCKWIAFLKFIFNYLQVYESIWNLNFKLQLWSKFKYGTG